jgi:molybdopterin/thiamine biosynthesis adenylyltransferase
MTNNDWYQLRNDRQMRYAGRVLPPDQPITIHVEPNYGRSYAGQVAALVAANLLARMTPNLAFSVPELDIVAPLPWAGQRLGEKMLSIARAADPFANFDTREPALGDKVLSLGRDPAENCVHGAGWYAFFGPGRSPIPDDNRPNPFGPGLAVVVAVGRLFARSLAALDGPFLLNAFRWSNGIEPEPLPFVSEPELGRLWTVGAGSVGTSALYFLTLATRRFASVTFDMDRVKIENLDRSPIFTATDAAECLPKTEVTTAYLRSVGVTDAEAERDPLDVSRRWANRGIGEPDLVIAAANERNVRYVIEQSCPPLQIYGTTGANWGASMLRHIPLREACSCCAFPPDQQQVIMECAKGKVATSSQGTEIDAALPFLSFAAGLMAAAEAAKTAIPGYPFTANRAVLSLGPQVVPRLLSLELPRRVRCVCQDRSTTIHRRMIAGSRYAKFSAHLVAETPNAGTA